MPLITRKVACGRHASTPTTACPLLGARGDRLLTGRVGRRGFAALPRDAPSPWGDGDNGNGPARYPQRLPSSLPPAFSPPWLTCPFPGLLSGGPVPPGFRLLAQPPEGSGSSESVSTADTLGHSFPPPCEATVRNTHGSAPPTFPGLGISRGGDGHPESCPPSQSHYI